jgi:hypothetical protein
MDIENFSEFIKKALQHYDNQNTKYNKFINDSDVKIIDEDRNNNLEIIFNLNEEKNICDAEILGYFDYSNQIWIWGWLLAELKLYHINICKNLLEYGLKLEPDSNITEHFMIKALLLNSRILIENSLQLDINLAIYSYLIKDKIYFIFPKKIYVDDKNEDFIIIYYLIKSIKHK